MSSICLISRFDLGRNTRLARQAKVLSEAGHDVTVVSIKRPSDELVRTTETVEYIEVPLAPWASDLLWRVVRPKRTEWVGTRKGRLLDPLLRVGEALLQPLISSSTTFDFASRASRRLADRKFDAVQAHDSFALPAAYRVARGSRATLIYDAVEITEHRALYANKRSRFEQLVWRWERWMEGRLTRKADLVITIGECLADWYAERYRIPRPVPIRNARYYWEPEPRDEIRRDAGLAEGDRLVVWIGSMDPDQGMQAVVDATALLPEDIHFAFLGRVFPNWRDYIDSVQQDAADRGLASRIHFLPERDPNDLIGYVSGADLGIIPRKPVALNIVYCMPNKLMEMIMGRLPIAATRELVEIRALLERYEMGDTFDVSSPEDVARTVGEMLQPKNLDRYKAGVMTAAKDLCWENESLKYLALFEPAAEVSAAQVRRALAAERETSARRAGTVDRLRDQLARKQGLYEARIKELQAQRAAILETRQDLLRQCRAQRAEIEDLRKTAAQHERVQERLPELRQKAAQYDRSRERFDIQRRELEELRRTAVQHGRLKERAEALQQEIWSLRKTAAQHAKLQERSQSLQNEVFELRKTSAQHVQLQERWRALQKEVFALRKTGAQHAQLQERFRELQQEVFALRKTGAQHAQLQQRFRELRQELFALRKTAAQHARLEERSQVLEERLPSKEQARREAAKREAERERERTVKLEAARKTAAGRRPGRAVRAVRSALPQRSAAYRLGRRLYRAVRGDAVPPPA
jgi:glycosyltransferase involved in cell wall biosynthesis